LNKQGSKGLRWFWMTAVLLWCCFPLAQEPKSRFPTYDEPDPRIGTPNDPLFDCAEPDDEDGGLVEPCRLLEQQYQLFGFAPAESRQTAIDHSGHPQVSGVSADLAWKRTLGAASVIIAVTDTGIVWSNEDVRSKIWLNRGELPIPHGCQSYDCNGDGAFNVDDYKDEPRVSDGNGNGMLDGQDLIRAFSDGLDDDGNGYIDDIAGWDFLDDDNDPEDAISTASAFEHGTNRARNAAAQTHNAQGEAGICPACPIMVTRAWDGFVMPGDQFAQGVVYSADNGARVQICAIDGLQNTKTARQATAYAHALGVILAYTSSDLNTFSHNYPTNYPEAMYINGCVPDIYGLDFPWPERLLQALNLPAQVPPVRTYFRHSNSTQYGAKNLFCMAGQSGSKASARAAGVMALLFSRGMEKAVDIGAPLSPNEIKQILTMTADDVVAEDTLGLGQPDRALPGWDEHFGYGRVNAGKALDRIAPQSIPPEALLHAPGWWALLDPVRFASVDIRGYVAARRAESCQYRLEWGQGIEPQSWNSIARGDCAADRAQILGVLNAKQVGHALPGAIEGIAPKTPNQYAITVRVTVVDEAGNEGEDRRVLFVYHDPTLHEGWPLFADTGGSTSPVFYDLDGDGLLEVIDANSSGDLFVYRHNGSPYMEFNDGNPWTLPPVDHMHPGAPAFASGAVTPSTLGWRTPAIADVDNDLYPDIVGLSGNGSVYVLSRTGELKWSASVDPALSAPGQRTRTAHPKKGFFGAPVIADIDADGQKEIIAGAIDGHIYVFNGRDGTLRPGFPARLFERNAGKENFHGEIITTPAVADLDGDGILEIVSASNSIYYDARRSRPDKLADRFRGLLVNVLSQVSGGQIYIHALRHDGTPMPGWPTAIPAALPDILPYIGPSHAVAVADFDGDGNDEVVASGTSVNVHIIDGDGSIIRILQSRVDGKGLLTNWVMNMFEYPVVGEIHPQDGLEIVKGGLDLAGVVNLVISGQNLAFDHRIQMWNARRGRYISGYPRPIDDYQLLSTPALADLNGDGYSEVLVGSGGYLIHAFDYRGREIDGFPKFTGGWVYSVPAIGDIDGDGLLEMAVFSREGYRFVWDLEARNDLSTNRQWWTESHDECHSNRYSHDCRPPAAISGAALENGVLTWRATGDDWRIGRPAYYDIRGFSAIPEHWEAWNKGKQLGKIETLMGGRESYALPILESLPILGLIAVDTAGNRSIPVYISQQPERGNH